MKKFLELFTGDNLRQVEEELDYEENQLKSPPRPLLTPFYRYLLITILVVYLGTNIVCSSLRFFFFD